MDVERDQSYPLTSLTNVNSTYLGTVSNSLDDVDYYSVYGILPVDGQPDYAHGLEFTGANSTQTQLILSGLSSQVSIGDPIVLSKETISIGRWDNCTTKRSA